MSDWSWGGWLLMTAMMLAFWAAVAWVIVVAIRASRPATPKPPGPEQVLAERLASGDIDEDDYRRRMNALHGASK